ncbi:MAG: HTH domain-containing protein [Desulfobacterales bacterium]|nr:HTH domain-containing protein [Desulfobacterales bacterium]
MQGDQLARQWRILRVIESRRQGATVAELAAQEDCSSRTIWRDLATIQGARRRNSRSRRDLHDTLKRMTI